LRNTRSFIKKAGTIILLSTIFVWFTTYFGWVDGQFQMLSEDQIDYSILAAIGGAICWIFAPLGWGNWQATVASITGLVAKENIVGIASRNRRFINVSNPAAVAVRDTLAFMADFGLYEDNKIYAQGSKRGAENTFNVNNIVMSFPIWRSSAFLVGLSPFSDVGYSFSSKEQSDELLGHVGNITYDSYGNGSLYQLYASAGATNMVRPSRRFPLSRSVHVRRQPGATAPQP